MTERTRAVVRGGDDVQQVVSQRRHAHVMGNPAGALQQAARLLVEERSGRPQQPGERLRFRAGAAQRRGHGVRGGVAAERTIGCQNWKATSLVQQMAFQHPPLRHHTSTRSALKMDCFWCKFCPTWVLRP